MAQILPTDTRDISLAHLNAADPAACAAMLGPLVERSPWLAERIAAHRPFATPADLAAAIEATVLGLGAADRLLLLRAHPELAMPRPEAMTRASQSEQGRLGLTAPSDTLRARIETLNARYRARFGFPFIIALHRAPDLDTVLDRFEKRLLAPPEVEIMTALAEVVSVCRARVTAQVAGNAIPDRDHDRSRMDGGAQPGAGS